MQHEIALVIMKALEIKTTALELFCEIAFLLGWGMDADKFIRENKGKKRIDTIKWLSAERNRLLDQRRYVSIEAFMEDVKSNRKAALEKLFGEHFNEGKLRYVPDNIETLYQIHSKDPYARFMKIAVNF